MRFLLFFLYFFFTFVFADPVIYSNSSNLQKFTYIQGDPCSFAKNNTGVSIPVVAGKAVKLLGDVHNLYNMSCILNNAQSVSYNLIYSDYGTSCSFGYSTNLVTNIMQDPAFCLKRNCYYYSSKDNAWYPNGNCNNVTSSVLCSPSSFNTSSSCVTTCAQGNIFFVFNKQNYCIPPSVPLLSKILGQDLSGCNFTNYNYTVESNSTSYSVLPLKCTDGSSVNFIYADSNLSLKDTNNTAAAPLACGPNYDAEITASGNIICVKSASDSNSTNSGDINNSTNSGDTNNSNPVLNTLLNNVNTNIKDSNNLLNKLNLNVNKSNGYLSAINNNTKQINTNLNEINKSLASINSSLADINSSLSVLSDVTDLKSSASSKLSSVLNSTKSAFAVKNVQYFSSSVPDSFPTLAVNVFGKRIVLLDNSYAQYIPFTLMKSVFYLVALFSAFLICFRTD